MRVEEIRRLIKLVEESTVNELEVRRWWTRVRILKHSANHMNENSQPVVITQAPAAPAPAPIQPQRVEAAASPPASTPP
jgi:biotin carboxyl carrier protein